MPQKTIKHLLLLMFILLHIYSYGAVRTAVADGNWGTNATWDCNCAVVNGDEVIIPAGITVTVPTGADLNTSTFANVKVSGTLNIQDNLNFNAWESDSVIVKYGGIINITQDLIFSVGGANTIVRVYDGGTINVGDDIRQSGSNTRYIYNYGLINVTGDLNTDCYLYNYSTGSINIDGSLLDGSNIRVYNYGYIEVDVDINNNGKYYNYITGLTLVHGSILGSASLEFNNDGIVTVDGDLNLLKTLLTNSSTGLLITFGVVTVGEGSKITNSGLVQCVDLIYAGNTQAPGFDNTGGTFIVQETVDMLGSNCPGCSTLLGTFYFGDIDANTATCGGFTSCEDFLNTTGTIVQRGRRLWLNASFIGYGLQTNNTPIYQWFDLANYYGFKMAQPTLANRPVIKNNATDNLNFNPVISFEGADLTMDLDANNLFGYAVDNGMGVFAVVVPKTNATQSVFDYGIYPTDGFGFTFDTEDLAIYTPTDAGGAINTYSHSNTTRPIIITQTMDWGGSQTTYINGTSVTSNSIATMTQLEDPEIANSATAIASTSGPFTLGGKSDDPTSNDFEGKIAELIIYSTDVTAPVRQSTESFLALKYGFTLPDDYTSFEGTTVYALDGTYDSGIFGLARQDLNHIHQRQSKSNVSGEVLTIATNTIVSYDQRTVTTNIAANNSFLVCGNNNGDKNDGSREYKITATNFNQAVKLSFRYSGISAPYPDLLVDDDPAFGSPTTVTYDSYDGNNLVFTHTFTNNAIRYFKLGAVTVIPREPGVGINVEAPNIDSTAELHIKSTTRGVLVPNVTTVQMNAITSPPTGLLVYNSDQNRYMFNAGTAGSPSWAYVGRFNTNTAAELAAAGGNYIGEIRYNTTNNTLYFWNGTSWIQLKDN